VLHAARRNTGHKKIAKDSPSGHHRTTLSGCIFATKARINNRKKNSLSSNISSTCPHHMVNFGPLAGICPVVWGTPANFNGFHVLVPASLLQRRRSTEASQTSHDVWPSPGLVHYISVKRAIQCRNCNSLGLLSTGVASKTRNKLFCLKTFPHVWSVPRHMHVPGFQHK